MAVVRKEGPFPREIEHEEPRNQVTQADIEALIHTALKIIGARLLLGVGLAGAIGLAVLAIQSSNVLALQAQGIFTLTVFGPLVWLSSKRAI